MATKPSDNLDWRAADTPPSADLIEPSSGKKANGWDSAEKPPYQYMNWIHYIVDKWLKYITEVFELEHNHTTGTHKLVTIDDVKLVDTATEQLTISDTSDGVLSGGVIVKADLTSLERSAVGSFLRGYITGDSGDRFRILDNALSFGDGTNPHEVYVYFSAAKTLTIDTNKSGGVLTKIDIKADDIPIERSAVGNFIRGFITGDSADRMTLSNNSLGFGPGNAAQDIYGYRPTAKTLQIDTDKAGGDLTAVEIKAVDSNFSGDINLASGKALTSPDVDGGTANSGRFLGGNGGFMFFDGTTTGTTAITLDSTLDWRDRWIHVNVYARFSATTGGFVPGGGTDTGINGDIEREAGDNLAGDQYKATFFYSEQGSTGTGSPGGVLQTNGEDNVWVYADSTSGDLKLRKSVDTGNEADFGLLVIFSDDQGHY